VSIDIMTCKSFYLFCELDALIFHQSHAIHVCIDTLQHTEVTLNGLQKSLALPCMLKLFQTVDGSISSTKSDLTAT